MILRKKFGEIKYKFNENNKKDKNVVYTRKTSKGKIKTKKKIQENHKYCSDIKIITPQETLLTDIEVNKPSTSKFSPFKLSDTPSPNEDFSKLSYPIIIKANLKKSTNSYIPKVLQLETETTRVMKFVRDKLLIKNTNVNTSTKNISTLNASFVNSKNLTKFIQDSNYDSSKTLEDLYCKVTEKHEFISDKCLQINDVEKKSELKMNKYVKDCNILFDIVQKNNIFLENTSYTNHGNSVQFYSLENKVIIIMRPESQFSFLGKFKLKVLYGALELYGSIFHSHNTLKPIEIYSPRGYSSITISALQLDGMYVKETLWEALTIEGVDRSLNTKLHDSIKECKDGWSILLLENLENTLTMFLNNYYSFKLFPKVENIKYSWCDPRRSEYILQANFQFSNTNNEISICSQWNKNITNQLVNQWKSTKSLCTMIMGGKGVGKSTTARYLINNLLRHSKKVILLDLDPGQAEMTPQACLSLNILDEPLLGPNFTHLKAPFYQLYLKDINVINCISQYIEYVKKLVEYIKNNKHLSQYPVIVNSMGFCKGIGLDIGIFLIKLIEPSNVIQITSNRARNNFDFPLVKETINKCKTSTISWNNANVILNKICDYKFHFVPSMAEGKRQFETWNMEPRQQRELVLLSYLSQIIKNADNICYSNFTLNSINNIIPYVLPFSAFYVSFLKSSIAPIHILAAMNGNIVALCGVDTDENDCKLNKEHLKYPIVMIKPPPCICYGYGIVRGIDFMERCIYINTPLTKSELNHVNLLTGCSPMPFVLLHSGERVSVPYAGDRGEFPTSRVSRRGYFRHTNINK